MGWPRRRGRWWRRSPAATRCCRRIRLNRSPAGVARHNGRVAVPDVSYRNLHVLADAGRWEELLGLAAAVDALPAGERRDVAHVVALEAPAPIAVAAVQLYPQDDTGFPGPLWEVAAHRPWHALAPHLTDPRIRHLIAQTRVLRGDDLRAFAGLESSCLDAPLRLEHWEAARWDVELDTYSYRRFSASACSVWACPPEAPDPVRLPPGEAQRADHAAVPLLDGWSPHVQAYAFRGTAWEAASTVAAGSDAWQLPFPDCYRDLMHLAAGTGAFSNVAGQAPGRLRVWAALRAMAGIAPSPDPGPVTAFVERLRCVGWRRPAEPAWYVHLAVEDPEQGISWVLTGADSD